MASILLLESWPKCQLGKQYKLEQSRSLSTEEDFMNSTPRGVDATVLRMRSMA